GGRLVQDAQELAVEAEQIRHDVAAIVRRERRPAVEGLDYQVFLGGPAPVDGGLARAGAGGDLADGDVRLALIGQQEGRGLDDRLFGPLAARTAGLTLRLGCGRGEVAGHFIPKTKYLKLLKLSHTGARRVQ